MSKDLQSISPDTKRRMILNLVKSFKLESAFVALFRMFSNMQVEQRQRVELASADGAFVDCPRHRLWSRLGRVLKSRFFKTRGESVRQHNWNWRAGNDDRG